MDVEKKSAKGFKRLDKKNAGETKRGKSGNQR